MGQLVDVSEIPEIHWSVPVALSIVTANVVFPILQVRFARLPGLAERLLLQFLAAALLAIVFVLLRGGAVQISWLVFIVGACNAIAAYWHWRAVSISLSLTALCAVGDDLLAMALGAMYLGEDRFLSLGLAFGAALLLLGGTLAAGATRSSLSTTLPRPVSDRAVWLLYVLGFSAVWGVAGFVMRYSSSVTALPSHLFLVSWYLGALLGAVAVLFFVGPSDLGTGRTAAMREILRPRFLVSGCCLSLVIVVCLALDYWSMSLAPLVVTQPIFQAAEQIVPLIVGAVVFREWQRLPVLGWLGVFVALCGGALVTFSGPPTKG